MLCYRYHWHLSLFLSLSLSRLISLYHWENKRGGFHSSWLISLASHYCLMIRFSCATSLIYWKIGTNCTYKNYNSTLGYLYFSKLWSPELSISTIFCHWPFRSSWDLPSSPTQSIYMWRFLLFGHLAGWPFLSVEDELHGDAINSRVATETACKPPHNGLSFWRVSLSKSIFLWTLQKSQHQWRLNQDLSVHEGHMSQTFSGNSTE